MIETREKIKALIDQLPDENLSDIERFLQQLLAMKKNILPKGKLGIIKPFNRTEIYDELLANRY